MPHPALIALTVLIATALRMQASLVAPLRLDILDYYFLYIGIFGQDVFMV